MLGRIYFSTQNYGKSPESIFLSLVKNIGSSTRTTFRDYDIEASKLRIAKIFSWYFALCNRYNFDAANIIWSKYPNVCPRCLAEVCNCNPNNLNNIDTTKLQAIVFANQVLVPKNINDWQKMFEKIYPCRIDRDKMGKLEIKDIIASIYARIFEELAEVAECIALDSYCDSNKKEYLANELADVFAWINSLCNSLNYYYNTLEFNIENIVMTSYPDSCNRCREARCVCAKGDFAIELAEKGAVAVSHFDKMTNLANASALEILLEKYDSDSDPYFVIFIDIDNFGKFNKDFGQHTGDEVLKKVAQELYKVFFHHKLKGNVFRRGGEEFIIVCNSSNKEFVYYLAEDLRRAIEDIALSVTEKITISLGIASSDIGSSSQVVQTADSYMQQAKSAGKNRISPVIDNFDEIITRLATQQYI